MNIDLDTTKKTLNICAKIGAGTIAHAVVRNNVTTTNPIMGFMVGVASFALAGAVAAKAGSELDAIVDDVAAFVNQSNSKIIHFG